MRELAPVTYAVLGAVTRQPTHTYAVAKLFEPGGALGRVWSHPRSLVYREIDRLIGLGLVEERRSEPGRGPRRTVVAATAAGRAEHERWLLEPVYRVRDFRSAFLLKLALLDLTGTDPTELIEAQRARFAVRTAELMADRDAATGFDAVLLDWRIESTTAATRFLETTARSSSGATAE